MNLQRKVVCDVTSQFKKACSRKYSIRYFSLSGIGKWDEANYSKGLHQQACEAHKLRQNTMSGQPTPFSHPHLLQHGELTSGIMREEYSARQTRLMELLQKASATSNDHIVILPGTQKRYMIDKIPYLFRQDTDMLYISGCLEAECVLVMHSLPYNIGSLSYKTVIFTQPYEPNKELWDGPRTIPSSASRVWGVDEGLPILDLPKYLESVEKQLDGPNIWYHYSKPSNGEVHRLLHDWLLINRRGAIQSPKPFINNLRLIKSPAEIKLMRQTCKISAESIKATMMSCKAPVLEKDLFATVDYYCRMKGGDYLAYPPVVAGGHRTNIIHYINNNNIIHPGELVLMDAGSEYRGYSGDVTRTWPVSGEFTPAQRDLYEAVSEVQKYVICACSRLPSLNQLFTIMCSKLGSVLQELGILPNSLSGTQLSRAAFGFCPHHVSHFLGMDVHDTPLVSKSSPLSPGTIITVEPGIYISERNSSVDPRFCGLGVRIEDDILIGDSGKVEVLSSACPTHPDDIEAIVGSNHNHV